MRTRILLLLMVWIIVQNVQGQDEPSAPLVYYYDSLEHAYAVQYVDSADGWLFAQDVMPEDHNAKSGSGWSPSYEWFAWASGNYGGYGGAFVSYPWIVHRGGTKQVTVLDGVGAYGINMQWSPTADLLLITYNDYSEEEEMPHIRVIDPEANAIMLEIGGTTSQPQWSPDGQYIHFVRTTGYYTDQPRREAIFVTLDGEEIVHPLGDDPSCGEFTTWHPDGRYISVVADSDWLTLENIATQSTDRVRLPDSPIQGIEWSPDGEYGLVYMGAPCGMTLRETQLWLLALDTLSLTLIHENIGTTYVDNFLYNYDSQLVVSWSPDSRKSLFWTQSGIFVYDVVTRQTLRTALDTRAGAYYLKMRWLPDSNRIAVSWGGNLYIYTLSTATQILLSEDVYNYELSPDGHYVAVSGLGICDLSYLCVVDTATGAVIGSIAPPSTARDWGGQVSFSWHADSQWFIVGLQQNGDTGRQFLMLSDITGEQRRELALCYIGASCVGWLPDTPPLTDWGTPYTPSLLPDAEINLGALPSAVLWHPDGERFAAATQNKVTLITADRMRQEWSLSLSPHELVEQLYWRDNRLLVLASDSQNTEGADDDESHLLFVNPDDGTIEQEFRYDKVLVGANVVVIQDYQSQSFEVRTLQDGELLLQQENSRSIALSDNDRLVSLDTQNGFIHVWQFDSQGAVEKLRTFEPEMSADIVADSYHYYSLLLTADGQHVVLGRYEQSIVIWNIDRGEVVASLPTFRFGLTADKLNIYTYSGDTVTMVPLHDEIPAHMLENAQSIVYYSAQTQRLITYNEPTINIWDLETEELIFTRDVWLAYTYEAPLAVSPDDRYLALTGTVGLWGEDALEIYDFESLELLQRYNRTAYGITWSPDSNILIAETLYTLSKIVIPYPGS